MAGIEDTYPALGDKISEARDSGYSDEDIQKYVQGRIRTATKAGYSTKEINDYLGDMPKPSIMEAVKGTAKGVAENALVLAPMMAGAAIGGATTFGLGGPIGGALGAGAGETLRQLLFDDEVKPSTIAFSAATGMIPGFKLLPGVTSQLGRVAIKAGEGGVVSGALGEAHKLVDQKGDYKFDAKDTLYNTLMGALFGTAFEGMFGGKKVPQAQQDKLRAVVDELSDPDKVTGYVKSALGKNYQNLTQAESMALVRAYQQDPGAQPTDIPPVSPPPAAAPKAATPAAKAPTAKPAQPYTAASNVSSGGTPLEDFMTRYQAGSPEERAQMKKGIRSDSGLYTRIAEADQQIKLNSDPAAARAEIQSALGDAQSLPAGPAKDAANEKLRSMGIDPDTGNKVAPPQAQTAGSAAPSRADMMRQMEVKRLKTLIKDDSFSPEDRAQFKEQLDNLEKETPPVYTSPKESPEVSAEVMARGQEYLKAAPAAMNDAMAEAQARIAQTAQNAPEQAQGELSGDFGVTPQPGGNAQPAGQPAPAAGIPGRSTPITAPPGEISRDFGLKPEEIALKKEAVKTAEAYRDPLDRPMTPAEQADWEKFVKENRVREWQERDYMLGELARVSEMAGRANEPFKTTVGAKDISPSETPAKAPAEIPKSFKVMTTEELGAILTDKKANPLGQGFARRELSDRAIKADAAKPESVDDAIARLSADNVRLSQDLKIPLENVDGDSIDQHVQRLKTPRGGAPIGDTFGPAEQAAELAKRQDVENLFRKLYTETKQNGLTMEQAAAKHNIPYAALDKMWREHLYPAEHFAWENVEPDVLRNRLKERDVLSNVYKNAKKQNITAEQAAGQMNIDPKVLSNISHEVKIDDALSNIGGTLRASEKLNERSKFLLAEGAAVQTTGTIRPGSKVTAREDVRRDNETYKRKISEAGFDTTRSQVSDTIEKFQELADRQRLLGSGLSARQAADMAAEAKQWGKKFNKYADQWFKDRMAWGRIGKAQQRPPIPLDLIDFMKKSGAELDSWRNKPTRTPILTSLGNMITNYPNMTPGERAEGWKNIVDAPRLGIFPLTSFTLDSILNASELVTQHISAAGADIGYGMQTGKWTLPNLRGAAMTWASLRNRIYSPEFEEAIGQTAMGEPVPGNVKMADMFKKPTADNYWLDFFQTGKQGAGTYKSNQASAALDTAWGIGMYAKGAVDTASKRFAGTMSIMADANKAADLAGIDKNATPLQHAQFVKDYWTNLPKDALDRAVDVANAAGFSRKLPAQIETVARSKAMQLFVDAFGRFPWQFGRWAADMLGANPTILRKIGAGLKDGNWNLSPEETMRYLARTATGIGGLALIDSHFYDKTDFQSLEYVDDDGNRMRLQGREPIASALFLSALAKGDWDKALGAAPYTSFPLLKMIYGGSGLLSNLNAKAIQSGIAGRAPWQDKQVQAEFIDTINHAIPGQAVLVALKSLTDPTVREGLGANLPGVSYLQDPKIDLTTGEPAQVTQHLGVLPDVSLPTIQGTPVPGMYREMNPVAQLLFRYGESTFRGMRQPLAGKEPAEAPEEATQQWQQEFGKTRNQFLSRLVPIVQQIEARTPPDQLKPGAPVYEAILARIKSYDAMAARQANETVNAKYGTPGKLPRKLTPRELRMPTER